MLLAYKPGNNPSECVPSATASTRKKLNFDPIGYCLTHGFRVKMGHNTAMCTHRAEGHKDTTTPNNTGYSTRPN